jgi:hypothetical protein
MSAPRPDLRLGDLDREELLELARHWSLPTQRDLRSARWQVASRRHLAALDELIETKPEVFSPEFSRLERRIERLEKAAEKAWAALELAMPGLRRPA